MDTHKPKNGITSILNNHYNNNSSTYHYDQHQDNTYTVKLKIGEIIKSEYSLKQKTVKKYRKIHGESLTKSEIREIISSEQQVLSSLDPWFDRYQKAKEVIFINVLRDLADSTETKLKPLLDQLETRTVQEICTSIAEYKESKSKLTAEELKEILRKPSKDRGLTDRQNVTDTFHNYIKAIADKDKDSIANLKMERLQPNLYEQCGSELLSFVTKLCEADKQYPNSLKQLQDVAKKIDETQDTKLNCPFSYNGNYYGKLIHKLLSQSYDSIKKDRGYTNSKEYKVDTRPKVKIYTEYREFVNEITKKKNSNSTLADLSTFNQQVKMYKNYLHLFKEQFTISSKEGETSTSYINKTCDKIPSVGFSVTRSYPYKYEPSLPDLTAELEDLLSSIKQQSKKDYLSLKDLSKEKIYRTPFKDKQGKHKEEVELTPQAKAHKWLDRYRGAEGKKRSKNRQQQTSDYTPYQKFKDTLTQHARQEIKGIIKYFEPGKQSYDYASLKDLSGWYWSLVRLYMFEVRDQSTISVYQTKLSHLCSSINGLGYQIERQGFQSQSIYLSDFYRLPANRASAAKEFKSSAFLLTKKDSGKDRLALGINFTSQVCKGSSSYQALVYELGDRPDKIPDGINPGKIEWLFNPSNNHRFFNYVEANKEFPLAYKYYTKPNRESFIDDTVDNTNSFILPLHFGKNQSRKYFWNQARGGSDNLVHQIFSLHSRLKVSSMRLLRQYNHTKQIWEYYLTLAIYRLEKATCNPSRQDTITGYDIGENALIATSTIEGSTGQEIPKKTSEGEDTYEDITLKHIRNHKSKLFYRLEEMKKQMKDNNYIDPKLRAKTRNKSHAVRNQTRSMILKHALAGKTSIFEDQYLFRKSEATSKNPIKNHVNKLMYEICATSSNRVRHDIDDKEVFGGVDLEDHNDNLKNTQLFDLHSLISLSITDSTSKLCSNCGHISNAKQGDSYYYIDEVSLARDIIAKKNPLRFSDYVDRSKMQPEIYNKTKKLYENNLTRYKYLDELKIGEYKQDLDEEDKKNPQTAMTHELFEEMYDKRKNAALSNKDCVEKYLKDQDKDYNPLLTRLKWYHGHVEEYRCFLCGNVTECDNQAGLNIARWKTYVKDTEYHVQKARNNQKGFVKLQEGIKNMEMSNHSEKEKILRIQKNQLFEKIKKCITKENYTEWYQEQLLKNGYTEEGIAKWNIPKD